MVFDDHDVSHLVVLIEASGSIGQDHSLYTEQLKYPHGQSDLGQQNRTTITLCVQEDFRHNCSHDPEQHQHIYTESTELLKNS